MNPTHGRLRGARRRARGRRRRPRVRLRPGGRDAHDPQPRPGRRQHRQQLAASTAGPTTSSPWTLPKLGHHDALRRRLGPGQLRAGDRREHEGDLPRDDRQPPPRRARHRGDRRRRPRPRHPARRRQHVRAAPLPPDRARRGHRHPLGHEVDRRARDVDRRRRRGRRHVRLGGPPGASPTSSSPTRATTASATSRRSGKLAFIIKLRVQGLRDLGRRALSPFNAFLFLQGLETLPLRIERHSAERPRRRPLAGAAPGVTWVSYPGLESPPGARATRRATSQGGFGGVAHLRDPRRPRGGPERSSTA